ncbi:MAG: hypothetical protein C7B46_14040 [Sulfobacillus benefaciens]|jgi:His/Glu/Gln/Arg/opine family amino acid ABC transporter permease subunit|uniref:ABC transmembrane type-1 domain-containing protein n=1 Tax=Sulfobacillus benefaciens TaxID=453960 RepID=A0A2T2XDF9_9FIRM|nr:MAG: hypothetical protein C7B46_14040 [Sulfobacillus benefaciens]
MHVVILYLGVLLQGGMRDVELTVVSSILALMLGALGAIGRLYGGRIIGGAIYWYVELIRGLPPILQLFVLFFGLSQFGIDLNPLSAAIIWLVAYGAGYAVEVFRAGIMDVAEGQHEAATALGLDRKITMRKIIIPQAFVAMLPNLTTLIVLQLKNTTLLYLIGYADMMYQARLGADATAQPGPLYVVVAIEYLVLSAIISRIGSSMEKRAAAYR